MSPPSGEQCPCGGIDPDRPSYELCCQPIHRTGAGLGATAEQLMRARYSAHVLADAEFILRSWHPDTRPPDLTLDGSLTWTGLSVLATSGGGGLETTGVVEFVARYVSGGVEHQLHERSTFDRIAGSWVYTDGHRP